MCKILMTLPTGTVFSTVDEAAIDFVKRNNPLTHSQNRETGTYIVKVKIEEDIYYTYHESNPGGHNDVVWNAITDYITGFGILAITSPWRLNLGIAFPVAFVHTHPYCLCHKGELFSQQDRFLTKLPGIRTTYLGTPSGMLYAYEGRTDLQRTVSSTMPVSQIQYKDSSI